MKALCSWMLQSSSWSCWPSHLSPVPWKCVCANVMDTVKWHFEIHCILSTDTKVCSFWWCVIATFWHNKDCTECPQGHGDGVGEWAASVSNWQAWESSWCGPPTWKADARATCLGAIQWCNLCCPVVFWCWCWAICHRTCLILVLGFSDTCLTCVMSFFHGILWLPDKKSLRCRRTSTEQCLSNATWAPRALFATSGSGGVSWSTRRWHWWAQEPGWRGITNVPGFTAFSDTAVTVCNCLNGIASQVSDLLHWHDWNCLVWLMSHHCQLSPLCLSNKYDSYCSRVWCWEGLFLVCGFPDGSLSFCFCPADSVRWHVSWVMMTWHVSLLLSLQWLRGF